MSAVADIEMERHLAAAEPTLAASIVATLNRRARRVSLRIDPALGAVVLVRPRGMSVKTAFAFVQSKRHWIARRLADLPPRIVFDDGVTIPFQGRDHVIRHIKEGRGGVWRENGVIYVSGRAEHIGRRVTDWLKAEAKRLLTPMVHVMAEVLGHKVARVSVRDTRSRWGSCSADGKLSFCWRLVLAPEAVLVYVAAHEVAHLRHLNHGRAFWKTLKEVLATYAGGEHIMSADAGSARQWLRRSGTALHSYG